MNEPKFKCGDLVAVPTYDMEVAIPQTTVASARYIDGLQTAYNQRGDLWLPPEGWYYKVNDYAIPVREACLRPILPGEYDTVEDEQELRV